MCGTNGNFNTLTCVANVCTCTDGTAAVYSGTGATLCEADAAVDCSACDAGYTPSVTPASGTLSTCAANTCTPTQVPNSNKADTGAITGTTGSTITVLCVKAYNANGGGTATCGTDGTFNTLTCTAWATCSQGSFVSVVATPTNDVTCTACDDGLSRAATLSTDVETLNYCDWCKTGLGKASGSSGGTSSHISCQSCDATVGDSTPEYNNAVDGSACGAATACGIGEGYHHVLSSVLKNTDIDVCTACSIGRYSNLANYDTCKTCVAGQAAPSVTEICATCDTGKYQEATIAIVYNCKTCAAGQAASSAIVGCAACATGKYQELTEATVYSCKMCAAGQAASSAIVGCADCATGKYQELTEATVYSCKFCAVGTEFVTKSNICSGCDTGKYQDKNDEASVGCKFCASGKAFDSITTACTACTDGKYQEESAGISVSCKMCAAGQFTISTSDVCTACVIGKFREAQAIEYNCKDCIVGEVQPLSGQALCISCINGTVQPTVGQSSCIDCVVGKYDNWVGEVCVDCAAGSVQPLSGQSSCIDCVVGKYDDTTNEECLACGIGEYQDEKGKLSCDSCESGKVQPYIGQSSCIDCAVGRYDDGDEECGPCISGKYQSEKGQLSCNSCDAGTFSLNVGATSNTTCQVCEVGQFAALASSSSCSICGSGQYMDEEKATACKFCAEGTMLFDGYGSTYGFDALKHDNINDCESCLGQTTAPVGSSMCTCEYFDGANQNTENCICKDHAAGPSTCTNNRYCYNDIPLTSETYTSMGNIVCTGGIDETWYNSVTIDACKAYCTASDTCNAIAFINDIDCRLYTGCVFNQDTTSSTGWVYWSRDSFSPMGKRYCKTGFEIVTFTYGAPLDTEAKCREMAEGKRFTFVSSGDYPNKGCWAHNSGTYQGEAYFGTGGSKTQMLAATVEDYTFRFIVGDTLDTCKARCTASDSCDAIALADNGDCNIYSGCDFTASNVVQTLDGNWNFWKLMRSTRCGATAGEVTINGEFIQKCPNTNGIEQILGSDKCVCGDGTVLCNKYEYCNDIGDNGNFQCQNMTDCRKNNNIYENSGDCLCRKQSASTYVKCDENSGRICNGGGGGPTCNKAMCINNVASIANTVECRCMQTKDASEVRGTCEPNKFCFDPVSVACNDGSTYSIFPACGCSDNKIESCVSEVNAIDGTTPNLLSAFCSCTSTIYEENSLCLKGQYCNQEFGVCANNPAPSCKHQDGKTPNNDPCLCGTEQCEVANFMCSPTAENKCHQQLCSDYEKLNPNWCNLEEDGYGNGVKAGVSCAGHICSDVDISMCCKECSGASIWDGRCRKVCSIGDDSLCKDEWVDPPTYGEYISDIRENSEDISYAWFKQLQNPFYAGHCEGATCNTTISDSSISNSTTDSKYCCLPSNNCLDDKSNLLCQGPDYTKEVKDKRCDRFLCTPEECCYKTRCNCEYGYPSTGRDCPTPEDGEYSCASCFDNYWLNGVECILANDCLDNQYEFRKPTNFSNRICYYKSICNGNQYELTPATPTSDRGCSLLAICTADEYISITSNITTGFKTSDIECEAFPTCTDVQYMVKTVNTAEGVTMTNYSCDIATVCEQLTEFETTALTSATNRICSTTALCQDGQYELNRPTPTTDRICQDFKICNKTLEYEILAPTNITNRICNTIKDCEQLTEFEATGPTNISDRVCNRSTICKDSEYETLALTDYTDRTCKTTTVCDADLLQYESIPNTTTTDRTCTTCNVTDTDCVGCMNATDCEYNTKSNVHNQSQCSALTCTRFVIPDGTFSGVLHYGEWFRFETNSTIQFRITAPNTIQRANYSYFYIVPDFNGTITFNSVALKIQQDCTFEEPAWGFCSKMCGAGHELGIRGSKIKEPLHGGKACSETPKITTRDCNGTSCPIDCNITWDDVYSPCVAACGKQGIQYKKYTILTPEKYGGVICPDFKRRGCVGLSKYPYCDCLQRKLDACGICGGDSSTCTGCDGIVDTNEETRKVYNECGICARKGTPCLLKRSQTQKDRKEFRSNLLRTMLPIGTPIFIVIAVVGICWFLQHTPKPPAPRKKRNIYLS